MGGWRGPGHARTVSLNPNVSLAVKLQTEMWNKRECKTLCCGWDFFISPVFMHVTMNLTFESLIKLLGSSGLNCCDGFFLAQRGAWGSSAASLSICSCSDGCVYSEWPDCSLRSSGGAAQASFWLNESGLWWMLLLQLPFCWRTWGARQRWSPAGGHRHHPAAATSDGLRLQKWQNMHNTFTNAGNNPSLLFQIIYGF